jgi:hypothetical protein
MSLADDLRALLVSAVQKAQPGRLPGLMVAMMGEGVIEDRRAVARPKAARKRNGKPKRTCPVKGCANGWSPRTGGFCRDHVNTAAAKAWRAARKKI